MQILIALLLIGLTFGLVQYFYIKWTGLDKEARHHKNSDYLDEDFKMNFIKKKVEDKTKYKD
ncbi:MAG: hypothetical protein Q3980_09005 [Turicibacter sp.]|nr:hypothetical protein [Turicibacter sp.]MDO5792867.1 hypothetical protein [Turicibacter sp.]